MSTICKTFSQIASSRACVWTRVINLSQQSKRFAYLEIIHVLDQLICVLQNSTPGGVGVPLPKTFSQIGVSRDQNLINFCFKMSICANSLWNSCNSGINIEAHSLGSQQLADHFPMRLPIEADLDRFKT